VVPLSVLDLSPVTTATPGSAALRNSLDLARLADRLGYKRYWVAEHHNLANIASSAPDIMIGQIAAITSHMRVGDQITSYALRARQDPRQGDDFLERFQELLLLERGGFPEGHPFRNVRAVPADVALPPIWLLGSSGYSAELAAAVGMGFSFAYHFADYDAASAMLSYRDHFKPSATLKEPYAILGTAVIAADSDAEAERIASSADLHYVRRAKGEYLPLASPEEAAAYAYTPADRGRLALQRGRLVVGGIEKVMDRLQALIETTRADELMITTMVYDHAARKHSYELLAKAFALVPQS
jgi:luciferase family oxidoreductase group 1